MTVTQVMEGARSLDGQTLRVRGRTNIIVEPSRSEMWAAGGCMPKTDPNVKPGVAKGWLTLYDPLTQDPENLENAMGIKIDESSFQCGGSYCKITCSPFQIATHEMYEFVGTLRVHGDSEVVLEEIDLEQSKEFIDGEWKPIPAGTFDLALP